MLLSRKLKIFSILTFVGLVFMTISFVSPGWVICKFDFIETFIQLDSLVCLDGYPQEIDTGAHLSAGLWYFSICIHRSSSSGSTKEERCHLSTYPFNFGRVFSVLDPSYYQVRGLNKQIILEIQIFSSTGFFCAVLGFIGIVVYTRRQTKSRWIGFLTCNCLSISGGTYITAVVKAAISTSSSQIVYRDERNYLIHLYCPWSLVFGGIGSFLILVSVVVHLCIIPKYITNDDIHVYHISKRTSQGIVYVPQHSFTIIAPSRCMFHPTIGLKIPLVDSMEKNEEESFVFNTSETYY